ncbi:hypothetical protein [Larkinella sp. C7]|jgi:hypothetical protein|uniref:hypothetical protein n=1 Tax=Larkinella sp. C7 TaxID=2576607 RepID=UPI00148715C7|nr:hypothetical protein [Larkinella sp. C7]
MLTKYELVNVPDGGVDHLISGRRVSITPNLTDEEADELIAVGLPYFQPKTPSPDGTQETNPDINANAGTDTNAGADTNTGAKAGANDNAGTDTNTGTDANAGTSRRAKS